MAIRCGMAACRCCCRLASLAMGCSAASGRGPRAALLHSVVGPLSALCRHANLEVLDVGARPPVCAASSQDAPAAPAPAEAPAAAEPPAQRAPPRAARGDAREPRGAAPSGAPAPAAPAHRAAAAAAPAAGPPGGDSGRPGGGGGGSGPAAPSADWVGAESRRLADALAAWRASRERKTAALRCAGALAPPPTRYLMQLTL